MSIKDQVERLYGLIGYPLSHSFSKNYFTQKFIKEQISHCRYELFPLENIELIQEIVALNPDLCGLNVTIPYKESVLPYLHHQNDVVKAVGACNCIRIHNGELTGFNTDVIGFRNMLLPYLQPHHRHALILGTGGAAKAVAWVLGQLNIASKYVSRSSGEQRFSYQEISRDILHEYTLIVNTTPLGMWPQLDAAPDLPYQYLTPSHLCVDLIYNPEKTKFLENAASKGATILNGMEMLIIQAEESWKIWNESL